MNARLRDYRLLWRAALTRAYPQAPTTILWSIPVLALLGSALAWEWTGLEAALRWASYVPFAIVLLAWMVYFVPGAAQLNVPAFAKLVPGMRRRLVELTCLVWLACIAGLAAALFLQSPNAGTFVFYIVVFTLGSGMAAAGHGAGSGLLSAMVIGSVFLGEVPQWVHDLASRPSVLLLSMLLYAGAIAAAAHAMFPEGGERHWRMLEKRQLPGQSKDKVGERIAAAHVNGAYARSLRRAAEQRDSRRLVLHALGPGHHLQESVEVVAVLCAILVALGLFTWWRVGADVVAGVGWVFGCVLLTVPLVQVARLNLLAARSAPEGALVRLAPSMPGGARAFNRHLGHALLVQSLTSWALGTGAALALTALGGATGATLFNLACGCCLLLPLLAAPLRNHARRAPLATSLAVLLLVVSAAMDILLGFSARNAGLPLLPVAALLSIVTALIAITRGLRVMAQSPFGFPAARMD